MNTSTSSTLFNNLPTHDYDMLLHEKTIRLQQLLLPFTSTEHLEQMSVYPSEKQFFRMRAEFGVWHEGDDCFYTMMDKDAEGNKQRVKVKEFAIANHAINQLMPELLERITANEQFKHKLFQVEFLSTLSGEMLITLIYHKKLDENWQILATELEQLLTKQELKCHIIGRSRKQKLVISQDYVTEKLQVLDTEYLYKQLEGGFTQPNAGICKKMLTWACEQAKTISDKKDLLELYCGNANFTLPLSHYYNNVLATEISKTSVAAAQWNIKANDIDNIAIARLSAEEFTEAKNGVRAFRRLKQSGIEINDYDFSTVFVDPPRAGIDDETLALLSEFDHIIYISCNPETLADNLHTLSNTHKVISTALFDQFPYTHHIEAGVFLKKQST